jgi:hypothetical protein
MVLPVLLLVVGVMLTIITGLVDRIKCVDAARVGVRAMERGEARDAMLAHVRAAAPAGARIETHDAGPLVGVAVTVPLSFHGILGLLDLTVRGDASGTLEPGVGAP